MLHFFFLFIFPYRKKARQVERDSINEQETFREAENASKKKKPRRCRRREQTFGHGEGRRGKDELKK